MEIQLLQKWRTNQILKKFHEFRAKIINPANLRVNITTMDKIEHIGLAVKDAVAAKDLFTRLLGTEAYKTETVESEGVQTIFFKVGETKIELLAATRSDSPIAKFIEKKGEGIHHLAFQVSNVAEKEQELKEKGFEFAPGGIRSGADNKLITFLHPRSTEGVLVEICQEKPKQ
jgi:methylmalonyl-CoA/ethylmalonyl-CoA epimerase